MKLDMDETTCYFKELESFSEVTELPSGHWAINILEFPETGWKNPYSLAAAGKKSNIKALSNYQYIQELDAETARSIADEFVGTYTAESFDDSYCRTVKEEPANPICSFPDKTFCDVADLTA